MVPTLMNQKTNNTESCRACFSNKIQREFYSPNMRSPKREKYLYFQCADCDSISLSEIPENLSVHYVDYLSFKPIEPDSFFRKWCKHILYKQWPFLSPLASSLLNRSSDLAHISLSRINVSKEAKILDVGCGSGQFLSELSELGFKNLIGIDPYLEKEIFSSGYQLWKKDIEALEGTWDLIMLNHVLEHVENCDVYLIKVKELLSPKGKVLIRIPNSGSYAFKRFKERWFGIQPPIHIILPSLKGMEEICKRNGFQIESFLGENVLELWLHSMTYELDIWDGHPYSICNNMQNRKLFFPLPTFSKTDIKYWRDLNRHIRKYDNLCDWIGYILSRE